MDLINYCYEISNNSVLPRLDKLQRLVKKCDINKEVNGKTALSYLVKTDHVPIVQWMISQGADSTRGHLLLEACNIASVLGQCDMDEFQERMDELGADEYIPDEYKLGYQNKNMYEFLLDIGLDVNDYHEDMNPLEAVCLEGDLDKIALLLRKDVDDITYLCKVKVHEAMEHERKKWLAVLVSHKPSIESIKQDAKQDAKQDVVHHLKGMHDKTLAQMLLPFL